MLTAKNIYLRALEPEDFEALYRAENDEKLWHLGILKQPISAHTIQAYLQNAHAPIQEAKQMRFAICLHDKTLVGLIDLYDFTERDLRAAVGVVIFEEFRAKGFAKEAILRLKKYAKIHLLLHQLYCYVQENNAKSVSLFKACGFEKTGTLVDWERNNEGYIDVDVLQCLL